MSSKTSSADIDTTAARELDLYAENTSELYPQFQAIIRNISKKIAAGKYDATRAPLLWAYWYDEAARRYCREFGGEVRTMFPKAVRLHCATERAADEFAKITNGE